MLFNVLTEYTMTMLNIFVLILIRILDAPIIDNGLVGIEKQNSSFAKIIKEIQNFSDGLSMILI